MLGAGFARPPQILVLINFHSLGEIHNEPNFETCLDEGESSPKVRFDNPMGEFEIDFFGYDIIYEVYSLEVGDLHA